MKILKIWKKLFDIELPQKALDENGKIMGGTRGMKAGMLEGDFEHGYVSVGNGISLIHEIKTVKEVVDDLMVDFKG